nr:tachykinin-like peptides receptor 86C [Pocillopora verrucosa]
MLTSSQADNGSTAQPPFSYPSSIKLTFAILYAAIISMALVGNILVIYILYKRPETRRLTSFMYVNLAVADLLVTAVVMPQSMELIILDNLWIDGTFGELLAKLIMFVFFVAVTASVFSLTAVAFDFFFGIVLPMQKFPRFRNKKILVPTIWITSMCLMTPWLITVKVKNSRIEFKFTQFGETQAALRGIFLYIVVTIYLLPLVTMCILYGHVCHTLHKHKLPGIAINNHARTRAHATKRQVIHMSIAVVVAFALCWLPAHAYHMILAIDFSVRESLPYYFMLLCYWCGHANSVVNPWLLIYLKKKFRAAFKRMITYPLSRISFASKNNESVRSVTKLPIRDPIVQVREHYQFESSV